MCRAEAPHLSDLQKQFGEQGLIVLGINCVDTVEQIRRFVETKSLGYRMLVRGDGVANHDYHCRAFPTLYWIDRAGKVAAKDYGYLDSGLLQARVKAIIGK